MNGITYKLLADLSIVAEKEKNEIDRLYSNAIENLDLNIADYLTIRDLVQLTGNNTLPVHVLLISMFMALNEGSVCLKLNTGSIENKLKVFIKDNINNLVKEIISSVYIYPELIYVKDSDPSIINNPVEEFKPLILLKTGKDARLYFQKYYIYEQKLKDRLNKLLKKNIRDNPDSDTTEAIINEILFTNPVHFNNRPVNFNKEQVLGILQPLIKNFVIISGGPGTGKTSIIINLIRALTRIGISHSRIKIAAPTGRAARRLTEAIQNGLDSIRNKDDRDNELSQLTGTTIHRLLRYSLIKNNFVYNSFNRIPADVIIIDEVSMVDVVMIGKLLEAIDDNARIVFLGDKNQLPSVDAGAVLRDMILEEKPADRVVILKENFRSEKKIKEIADGVNNQDIAIIKKIPELHVKINKNRPHIEWPFIEKNTAAVRTTKGEIWRIEPERSGIKSRIELHALLDSWADHHYLKKQNGIKTYWNLIAEANKYELTKYDNIELNYIIKNIFSYLDRVRILAPVKSGFSGTTGINNYLAEKFRKKFDTAGRNEIFSGSPIIITRNDHLKGLFNGDVGVIIKSKNNHYYALFFSTDSFVSYPVEILPAYELAYAITIHKSQGSEYEQILIIIPDDLTDRLLTKEIIYTGLTRTRSHAMIYCSEETLKRAIMNKMVRESGILFEYDKY